jgi:CBS domain-containing protein
MATIKNILKEKGDTVYSVSPNTPVFEALQLMAEKDIGALVVVESGQLVGIFSDRDYARKVILKGKSSKNTPVKEIMTSEVVTARPQQTVDECLALMNRTRIRYLPVLQGSALVGLISIGDVAQAIIAEQEEELENLENLRRGENQLVL